MECEFLEVLKHGCFAYPASSRYSRPTKVICDRCDASDIPACVGLDTTDLCMDCVAVLVGSRNGSRGRNRNGGGKGGGNGGGNGGGGKNVSDLTAEELAENHRIIAPNSVFTTDYVPSRKNYHVDDKGFIIRISYG